jgi:protoheme IX farnesyltransferase
MEASRFTSNAAAGAVADTRVLLGDYFSLTKPKVQSLLLLTTATTMYVAANPTPSRVLLTCLGGYLSAGGAGAINHYWDRDIDAQMARTANRPVPSGRVSPRAALIYGAILALLSVLLLATTVNVLAAALSMCGFVGYVGVYTIWLKRRTEHRHRRSGRSRPAARRMGRRDRSPQLDAGVAVRDRLLLDAAALLGAQPADEG